MDIRVLKYFLAVAREGSITRAAELLHMTQPPLSRQLKELEDELGKTLFIRGSKRIALTEDGELLRKRAEEIVELMDKTVAELGDSDKDIQGEVYIGSGETRAITYLAKVAVELKSTYPHIRYHIFSGNAEYITEKLDKGLIDFGILIGFVNDEKYSCMSLPFEDTWGVLMKKDSPLSKKVDICPEDLYDKPLIVPHQVSNNKRIMDWLDTDVSKLNIALKYDLIYNASLFVEQGMGYAIALDKLINTAGDTELCFRPLEPSVHSKISVVWKKQQVLSKASNAFLSALKKGL